MEVGDQADDEPRRQDVRSGRDSDVAGRDLTINFNYATDEERERAERGQLDDVPPGGTVRFIGAPPRVPERLVARPGLLRLVTEALAEPGGMV